MTQSIEKSEVNGVDSNKYMCVGVFPSGIEFDGGLDSSADDTSLLRHFQSSLKFLIKDIDHTLPALVL